MGRAAPCCAPSALISLIFLSISRHMKIIWGVWACGYTGPNEAITSVHASRRALTASDTALEEPQKRRNGFRVADFDMRQTTLGSKSRHRRWSFC